LQKCRLCETKTIINCHEQKAKNICKQEEKQKTVHLWWVPSGTVCSKERKNNQPENKKKKSHGNKITGEANRGETTIFHHCCLGCPVATSEVSMGCLGCLNSAVTRKRKMAINPAAHKNGN